MSKNPHTTMVGSLIWQNEDDELHRLDGPAIIRKDGTKLWYQNGKPHRVGGPACVGPRGRGQRWYQDGVLHRLDGPAIIFSGGAVDWHVLGVDIKTFKHFQQMTNCSDEDILLLKLKWGDITWRIFNRAEEWASRT